VTYKKTTIKDVACAAGVSTQTISRVLNHRPDVATKTRKRVLRVMARLHYSPSSLARQMRWQATEISTQTDSTLDDAAFSSVDEMIYKHIKIAMKKGYLDSEKAKWFLDGVEKGYFTDKYFSNDLAAERTILILCSAFTEITFCEDKIPG
jgi:transcriptional regulator with XRE-family HTH domain